MDHCHPSPEKGILSFFLFFFDSFLKINTQILDLESRNAALQDDLSTAPAKRAANADWLPRNPPAHTLTSHRAPITQLAFHPLYSVIASASEDATVKIWDWETGDFERTLKGHTKSVNDLNFDHKGHLLGNNLSSPPSHFLFTGILSHLLLRPFHQDMGLPVRIQEHKDISRPRTFRLLRTLHARRSVHHQCQ